MGWFDYIHILEKNNLAEWELVWKRPRLELKKTELIEEGMKKFDQLGEKWRS